MRRPAQFFYLLFWGGQSFWRSGLGLGLSWAGFWTCKKERGREIRSRLPLGALPKRRPVSGPPVFACRGFALNSPFSILLIALVSQLGSAPWV